MEGIMKMTGETELMQSFLRVDQEPIGADDGVNSDLLLPAQTPATNNNNNTMPPSTTNMDNLPKTTNKKELKKREKKVNFNQLTKNLNLSARGRRRRGVKRQEEVYTDKDRAAAVVMGSKDIKQSLKLKQKRDRSATLQIPEEADCEGILALSSRELRLGHTEQSLQFVNKALELSPGDKHALVARSRCYLLLGKPTEALQDAESALEAEPGFIKGILQKAEALYHLGDFEHSLVFFHRGLRARPECRSFRLGVQKAQEAIENTIGGKDILWPTFSDEEEDKEEEKREDQLRSRSTSNTKKSSNKTQNQPKGPLSKDKLYLEQLLKNPDLRSEDATRCAQGAIEFLNTRQRFWQQQSSTRRTR